MITVLANPLLAADRHGRFVWKQAPAVIDMYNSVILDLESFINRAIEVEGKNFISFYFPDLLTGTTLTIEERAVVFDAVIARYIIAGFTIREDGRRRYTLSW